MPKGGLWLFATIVGLIACAVVLFGPAFAKGVRQSDACTSTNTDHWLCQMAGDGK